MARPDLREQGAASVEFALVTVVLLVLVFGAMELGRLYFVWNSAQEVTRRAARDAAVWGFAALSVARYDAVLAPPFTTGTMAFPGIGEITNWSVSIRFMEGPFGSLIPVGNPPASALQNQENCTQGIRPCVTAVQVRLCVPGSQPCQPLAYLPLGIPGMNLQLGLPLSTVTIPLEGAGAGTS